jgi:DNA-binding transcriptional regulator YiaG
MACWLIGPKWSPSRPQPEAGSNLLDWEEQERARRSLERRLQEAHIGRFKSVCDFDWTWPKRCDRSTFEALMSLDFLKDATNVVMVGPNGVSRVKVLRQRLGMTEVQFADAFHLPITTLRDWEQHRSTLDAPARALLLAIERDPELMRRLPAEAAA